MLCRREPRPDIPVQWKVLLLERRFGHQCRDLKIDDFHFHDLRHEGTSRLFEAGFSTEQVSLVTGHKDWKMLRRYTHLKPEALHNARAGEAACGAVLDHQVSASNSQNALADRLTTSFLRRI